MATITRQALVEAAYAELGVSNEFDVSPDEITRGVAVMNRMLATWHGRNIRIGYAIGTDPAGETGIGQTNEDPVAMNLALRLAPGIGKVPSLDLKREARLAYLALLTKKVRLIPVQQPAEMPAGAGNRRFSRRNFLQDPVVQLSAGSGDVVDDLEVE